MLMVDVIDDFLSNSLSCLTEFPYLVIFIFQR